MSNHTIGVGKRTSISIFKAFLSCKFKATLTHGISMHKTHYVLLYTRGFYPTFITFNPMTIMIIIRKTKNNKEPIKKQDLSKMQ